MKNRLSILLIILTITLVCCDDTEETKSITDSKGLIVKFSWITNEPLIHPVLIGLNVYDPEETLIFGGKDSLQILDFFIDGPYTFDAKIYDDIEDGIDRIDYKIEVQGINGNSSYLFKNSFRGNVQMGATKTSLIITKDDNSYIIRKP